MNEGGGKHMRPLFDFCHKGRVRLAPIMAEITLCMTITITVRLLSKLRVMDNQWYRIIVSISNVMQNRSFIANIVHYS